MTHPWLAHYPKDVRWDAEIAPRPLYTLLLDAERDYGDKPFLDFMGRKFSFKEVADKARRFASALQTQGFKPGDALGLFLPNCPQFVIGYYGTLLAGGIVINFNPVYTPRELEHQIRDSNCRAMLTLGVNALYPKLTPFLGTTPLQTIIVSTMGDALPLGKSLLFPLLRRGEISEFPKDAHHRIFSEMLEEEPILSLPPPLRGRVGWGEGNNQQEDGVNGSFFSPPPNPLPQGEGEYNAPAVLQYTGGTTGVPKGTVLTHANLYVNTLQAGLWFHALKRGEEKMIGVLPLFHVFAMTTVMNFGLNLGVEIILHPRFDMKSVLDDIQNKKVTFIPAVPSMFAAINHYKSLDKYDLSSLKCGISGGAPLPVEVKREFEQKTGATIVEGYGLSETSPVAAANPLVGVNKPGSIGMPLPQTILEVVSIEDRTTVLPPGEKGEICIRGPQVMRGYWNKPEETANVLRNGRFHSGDIGTMDEEGYFFIVDRLKEMIITGGYNVYPRNIEEVLYAHPAVLEAAVIGLPDESRGQVGKAFVVKKEGAAVTEAQLNTYLRENVAAYAVPAFIEFRDALPKSLIGKILKKDLLAEEMGKRAHT